MLRTTYFYLAMISAACFALGGIVGVCYEAWTLLHNVDGGSTSSVLGWLTTGGGLIGYILFSYLFVLEDDKEDTDPDDDPSI